MHTIQTRSKTRLEAFLAKTVIEVERRCSEVSRTWDASVEKKDLIRQIDEKVLIQERLFIDSAIYLGLGPLELYPENYAEYYDVVEDMWAYCVYESKKRLSQLLVFESILNCLRKYCFECLRFSFLIDPQVKSLNLMKFPFKIRLFL
jgi:hypothetical protein